MAEHLALAYVGQVVDRPTDVFVGYMAAVIEATKSPEQQLRPGARYGCVKLFGQQMLGCHHIRSVSHVKAHRSADQYAELPDFDKRLTDANVVADAYAKRAVQLHESVPHELDVQLETRLRIASGFV
eukprot:2861461-Pyramimonas_sp.AAC.1